MNRLCLFMLCALLLALPARAQNNLILSKDTGGTLAGKVIDWALRANAACDQSATAFPDGSHLQSADLTLSTDANGLGLAQGTVQIFHPDGRLLQVLTLRGTFGLNTRRDTDKDCRSNHIEALLEPVPTFAAPDIPQIALATLSADLDPRVAGPVPVYRAKLDGVVTLPVGNPRVTLNSDKNNYGDAEAVTAVIFNNGPQTITAFDLKSYCSIVRLQRQSSDGQWLDVGQCLLKRVSFPISIGAGETRRIVLQPNDNANAAKTPGLYRLALDYVTGVVNAPVGEALTLTTPTFRVDAMPVRQTVKLVLDPQPVYAGETIAVQLVNDTDLPVQTEDHKTGCTVFDLQRRDANGNWVNVAPCLLASPTKQVRIAARQTLGVKLADDGRGLFTAGTYRLALTYQIVNTDQTLGANTLLMTPEFTLRARQ